MPLKKGAWHIKVFLFSRGLKEQSTLNQASNQFMPLFFEGALLSVDNIYDVTAFSPMEFGVMSLVFHVLAPFQPCHPGAINYLLRFSPRIPFANLKTYE